jgi:hypothetical protein
MYTVGQGKQVEEQIAALPSEALVPFHEATVFLQVALGMATHSWGNGLTLR